MTKTRNTKGETARRQRRWLCALGEKKYTSYVKLGDRSSTGMRGSLSKKKFMRALVVCAASLFLSTKNAFARLLKTDSEEGKSLNRFTPQSVWVGWQESDRDTQSIQVI